MIMKSSTPLLSLVAALSVLAVGASAVAAQRVLSSPASEPFGLSSGGILLAQADDLLAGDDDLLAGDDDLLAGDDDLLAADGDDLLLGDDEADAADGDDLLGGDDDADDGLLAESGDDDLLADDAGDEEGGDSLLAPGDVDDEVGAGDELLSGDSGEDDALFAEDDADGGDGKADGDAEEVAEGAADAHAALFLENRFPTATTCRICHPRHFDEWSVSQHAYAQLSPVFNAMHGTVLKLTNGTNGDFCIRCHTPVGMVLGEQLFMTNMDRHPTSREGITCIACHRLAQDYGKVNGRLPIVEGDITQPIYGPTGDKNLKIALDDPEVRVTSDPDGRGRKIHGEVIKRSYLSDPGFCGSCHDVTLVNGFRLEEAFSEYKMSPAAARGETCQDCHMSTEPGVASGYAQGPAAIVGGIETPSRKLTNHMFAGPDHSVIHPGLFPLNEDAQRMATMREWLLFDHKAGWGTDEFEDNVGDDYEFPERWSSIDDRFDARPIIDQQLERLEMMAGQRKKVLQQGYRMGKIDLRRADSGGLEFAVEVSSGTDGHNVPTGFTGERLVFLQVTVTDAAGEVVFQSGDLDPNGDVRDLHSLYVHNGELPQDTQLFSLQSNFITRNVRGGEREVVLAVNFSPDPLPFLRPDIRPTVLTGRTLGARIHKKGIEPNGRRTPSYRVDGEQLSGNGPYTINVKLIAAMVPINLIAAIKDVGFDYNMSPREIADAVLAGHQVLAEDSRTVEVGSK